MNWKSSKAVYHGVAWGIAVVAAVFFLIVLNSLSGINVVDTVNLVFTDDPDYGEWEYSVIRDGIEQVYSSANGDDPAKIFSPFEYWLTFHGVGNLLMIVCGIAASIGLGYGISSAFFRYIRRSDEEQKRQKNEDRKGLVFSIVFVVIFVLIVLAMLFLSFNLK